MSGPIAINLYLDLLERCLTRILHPDRAWPDAPYSRDVREIGQDWPTEAETMIGIRRLHHLRQCAETVLQENIPGDFLEAGTWRGGAGILLRGVLAAYEDCARIVWLADSFQGLPGPNAERYPQDAGLDLSKIPFLSVPLDQVRANFARYGLLDARVSFLPGWFRDTLPTAPVKRLALLRLDGDLYESTIDTLNALYGKVSPGGYVIIDDYGAITACRAAVDDFRKEHNVEEPIESIDWTGICWRLTIPQP
jgi:hypothetical protein